MNQQARRTRKRLAVDILHGNLRRDVVRTRRFDRFKINFQNVFAARVGHAFERLRRAAAAITAIITAITPPRRPRSERIISAIRRRVIGRIRRHRPVRVGVRQTAARVIFRFDRNVRRIADEMRRFGFDFRRNFKFRSAKFLNLKIMIRRTVPRR